MLNFDDSSSSYSSDSSYSSASKSPKRAKKQPSATGLEFNRGGKQPLSYDIKIINGQTDQNQLIPFKYNGQPQAPWQRYLDSLQNNWHPVEISMSQDIAAWKQDHLNEAEKHLVMWNLGYLVSADSLVANNVILGIYEHITSPEARQYYARQIFEEALHTHSYQHIIESLGLDGEDHAMFNKYRTIDSIADKAEWNLDFTKALTDQAVIPGSIDANRLLIEDLVAFLVFEGLYFWCAFAHIFCLARNGKMVNTAEQYQYIMRDENQHFQHALWMLNQIKKEYPKLWNAKTEQRARAIINEAVELERAYAIDCMPDGGVSGLPVKTYIQYVEYIANVRCVQLGLKPLFKVSEDPMPWMDEMVNIRKEKNFFETRVTDYRAGGSLEGTW